MRIADDWQEAIIAATRPGSPLGGIRLAALISATRDLLAELDDLDRDGIETGRQRRARRSLSATVASVLQQRYASDPPLQAGGGGAAFPAAIADPREAAGTPSPAA